MHEARLWLRWKCLMAEVRVRRTWRRLRGKPGWLSIRNSIGISPYGSTSCAGKGASVPHQKDHERDIVIIGEGDRAEIARVRSVEPREFNYARGELARVSAVRRARIALDAFVGAAAGKLSRGG